MPSLRIGTCGFCLPQEQYFHTFPVIEIQQTFYWPPQLKTVERWRQKAPDEFEFALKAFQAITHDGSSPTYRRAKLSDAERQQCGSFRDTPVVRAAWQTTLTLARALRATIVVFQCPARFRPTDTNLANLRRFFQWADRGELRFGFEPRGSEWREGLLRELCRELELVHIVDPFVSRPCHGGLHYFRLHGKGGYNYRYTDRELDEIRALCTERLTYVMFNNTEMLGDARRFIERASPAQ